MESDQWQVDLNAWDNAAGALLVQEATACSCYQKLTVKMSGFLCWYLVHTQEIQELKLWKHLPEVPQVDFCPRDVLDFDSCEAGGLVTDCKGSPYTLSTRPICATNGLIHFEL